MGDSRVENKVGNKIIVILLLLITGFSYVIWNYEAEAIPLQISVITRDYLDDYGQSSLKQGIEEATNLFDVDVSMMALSGLGDIDESKKIIEQEIRNGTQVIIMEPLDDQALLSYLLEVQEKVKIIFLKTSIGTQTTFPVIGGPESSLTQMLLTRIGEERTLSDKNILILSTGKRYQDIGNREKELGQGLVHRGAQVTKRIIKEQELDQEYRVKKELMKADYDIVIATDTSLLDTVSRIKSNTSLYPNLAIYGYGKNTSVMEKLELGHISTLGLIDDYSMGYLSVKEAVTGDTKSEDISYTLINKETMFLKENRRFLFPIFR